MKFPTGFTYRNLHGFERFPGDSTALVLFSCMIMNLVITAPNCRPAPIQAQIDELAY